VQIRVGRAREKKKARTGRAPPGLEWYCDEGLKICWKCCAVDVHGRTEAAITKLTEAMTEMRKEIAGLGETIGFGLEDIAHVVLPGWLARHERLRIEGLERRTVSVDERQLEFDLYGEGSKGKTHMIVLGEVKSRIHPSDVEEFTRRLKEAASVISGKVLPLMFGYWIHPAASLVAKKSRIRLIASYQR